MKLKDSLISIIQIEAKKEPYLFIYREQPTSTTQDPSTSGISPTKQKVKISLKQYLKAKL